MPDKKKALTPTSKTCPATKERHEDEETVRLRQELAATKVLLTAVTQKHDTANEELMALNEELQSSNEEMQSINEEMATASEELQSTNEELTTVNDELQSRNKETTQLNNDLLNVLRGVEIPIILLGSGLQIRRFNDSAARLLNLIPSDTGRPLSDIRTNISIADLEQMVLEVITSFIIKSKEVQDAEGRWYSLTIRPYKTVDNRIDGVLMTLVDIDEIKRTEAALRKSNTFNQSIIDSSNDCIKLLDLEGRLQYMSSGGQRQLGIRDMGKYLNLPYQEFWKGTDHHASLEAIHKARKGQTGTFQGFCPTVDGEPKWWDVAITPVLGEDGKPERLLAVSRDVTERRKAEEALQASLDRYRSYIEVTGALGWTTNPDGEVVDDIPSWRLYTGQTYEEIKGHGWSKAVHPEDLERVLHAWEKALQGKSNYEIEYRIRRHDGIYRHFMTRGMPVFQENGGIREWVGICVDISERKTAEEKIITLNESLNHRARELERAYKDMESFSYAAAHDLRSPLITIEGFSRILLEDYAEKLDDEGRDCLKRIGNSTKKMNRLIADLLAFSKISTKEIQKSVLNMSSLAHKVVDDLRPARGERIVNFDIKQLPPASGDRSMIDQVFVNLVSNAVKFTQTREAAMIEVGGYIENDENVYFVRDNGIGFDMQLRDRLFGFFQRLHTAREIEGTGIGLVIVKNIIEKHGGRVWAEGKPDEGATFYFTLPRAG